MSAVDDKADQRGDDDDAPAAADDDGVPDMVAVVVVEKDSTRGKMCLHVCTTTWKQPGAGLERCENKHHSQ